MRKEAYDKAKTLVHQMESIDTALLRIERAQSLAHVAIQSAFSDSMDRFPPHEELKLPFQAFRQACIDALQAKKAKLEQEFKEL